MKKSIRILSLLLILGFMIGGVSLQSRKTVYADEYLEVYQVNGEYSLTTTSLVTKCRLEMAYDSLEKKTRTYKITKKTKIKKDYSKKALKGKKRTALIKKLNKKQIQIQFQEKDGVVKAIWPVD